LLFLKFDIFIEFHRHGEWLFPATLPADLDLEQLNPADQFVPTYLAGDMLPRNAGGLPTGTGD
jgi:hypothetical protein